MPLAAGPMSFSSASQECGSESAKPEGVPSRLLSYVAVERSLRLSCPGPAVNGGKRHDREEIPDTFVICCATSAAGELMDKAKSAFKPIPHSAPALEANPATRARPGEPMSAAP